MKFVVTPKKIEDIDYYYKRGVRHIMIGLEGFSTGYPNTSLEEMKSISNKYNDIFFFIVMNKMMFNEDLPVLEDKLRELEVLPHCAVTFYDLAILSLFKKYSFSYDLVWHQSHMVTNYHTAEYFCQKGVKYGLVSPEITLDEIIEMNNKSNMIFIPQVFGRLVMGHSKRKLLSNYFSSIELEAEEKPYELSLKDIRYSLEEDETGTSIFTGQVLNGLRAFYQMLECNIEYTLLDFSRVKEELSNKAFEMFLYANENFSTMTKEEKEREIEKSEKEISNFLGFFYQKTIYKVKRDEK